MAPSRSRSGSRKRRRDGGERERRRRGERTRRRDSAAATPADPAAVAPPPIEPAGGKPTLDSYYRTLPQAQPPAAASLTPGDSPAPAASVFQATSSTAPAPAASAPHDFAEERPNAYKAFERAAVRPSVGGRVEVALTRKTCLDKHVPDFIRCVGCWMSRNLGDPRKAPWRLQTLDLSHNELQDASIIQVVEALEKDDVRLNVLRLRGNRIHSSSLTAITQYMWRSAEALAEVDLAENEIVVSQGSDGQDPVSALLRCIYNHSGYPRRVAKTSTPEEGQEPYDEQPLVLHLEGNLIADPGLLVGEICRKGGRDKVRICGGPEAYPPQGKLLYLSVFLPNLTKQRCAVPPLPLELQQEFYGGRQPPPAQAQDIFHREPYHGAAPGRPELTHPGQPRPDAHDSFAQQRAPPPGQYPVDPRGPPPDWGRPGAPPPHDPARSHPPAHPGPPPPHGTSPHYPQQPAPHQPPHSHHPPPHGHAPGAPPQDFRHPHPGPHGHPPPAGGAPPPFGARPEYGHHPPPGAPPHGAPPAPGHYPHPHAPPAAHPSYPPPGPGQGHPPPHHPPPLGRPPAGYPPPGAPGYPPGHPPHPHHPPQHGAPPPGHPDWRPPAHHLPPHPGHPPHGAPPAYPGAPHHPGMPPPGHPLPGMPPHGALPPPHGARPHGHLPGPPLPLPGAPPGHPGAHPHAYPGLPPHGHPPPGLPPPGVPPPGVPPPGAPPPYPGAPPHPFGAPPTPAVSSTAVPNGAPGPDGQASLVNAPKDVIQKAVVKYLCKLDEKLEEDDTLQTLAEFSAILAASSKPAAMVEEELSSLLDPALAKPLTDWLMDNTRPPK
eukprot:TRINITY_DN14631_c0_g1_i1.p1 TRINITY_DN14631_c0_g1~~TRINITY_DN14631_c0_g1_i1.p1  ORF type:complete len:826 (+),score=123.43 TRINITY_DN14631_c0_g1_i1:179-2656(+)